MSFARMLIAGLFAAFFAQGALAQGTQVPFGGLRQDASLPVEITADQLKVDQGDGSAEFIGNVRVGQGEMRLSAARVRVEYAAENGEATGRISRLLASGGVTLVNGAEAAEADEAEYSIEKGQIVMIGHVILTQGANALSSARMVIDLNKGSAVLHGRVKTIFKSGGNP